MSTIGQPKQTVPIFVGSTYEDLKEYRDAVNESLHRLETIVRGMEYFGAKPGSPKEECLKVVRSCRVYVGIFAMRYGSIDAETGRSMTHLEYDEACKLGLPCLIYLIDEEKQAVLPKFVETGIGAEYLKKLKDEIKKKWTVNFFTTPDDLAKKIAQDLPPILIQIGVTVTKEALITPPDDAKVILQKFRTRPRRHGGKEIIIEAEMVGDTTALDADECEAFRLLQGEAIKRKVKSDLLGNSEFLIASEDMADWLENAAKASKVKLKIRLVFGTSSHEHFSQEEGPTTFYQIHTGFRIIAVI
jgi:hypothetical protein